MAELRLAKLNKVYERKVWAVKNVNLLVEDHEFLVLVGPSGCGKSTILRMIAGLEEVSSGDVFIGQERVNDFPPGKRDIAMVFQNYALYPHMTVYNNLAFALKMRKRPREEIADRVARVAGILEIEGLLQRKPRQLSGGQRQRVALGRAIIREPRICLMDEPLSNLDARLRGQMRAEICRLHQKLKTTMIYVTHDQTEAMTMGSMIAVLNEGEIQQLDTPFNVYHNPANVFVAGFIGNPPMNLLNLNLAVRYGRPVIAGIRAEDIAFVPSDQQSPSLVGTVDLIENLGAEWLLHFDTEYGRLVVRARSGMEVALDDQVELYLDPERIHLFDAESGIRIGRLGDEEG